MENIILKSIALILFANNILLSQVGSYSYSRLISESFEEIPVKEVIAVLSDKYQLTFGYSSDLILNHKINARFHDSQLNDVLDELFEGTEVEYKVMGKEQILLRSASEELLSSDLEKRGKRLVQGRILDSDTGIPVENAAIFIEDAPIGSFSNAEGEFQLVFSNSYAPERILISLLGYERKAVPIEFFNDQSQISIRPESFIIDPISIVSAPQLLQSINKDLSLTLQNGAAGFSSSSPAGNDLFRNIQLLSGVSAHNDNSTEITIRGSEQTHNLVILDGIPIYHSDHFYGIFSNINSSYVESVNLYKNAIPIEYGGKTGGMLLLNSSTYTPENFEATFDINLLYTSGLLKIPMGTGISLFLAGRTTLGNTAESKFFDYSDAVNVDNFSSNGISRQNLIENTPSFTFQDWNGKLLFQIEEDHTLDFNFFKSEDRYDNGFTTFFRTRNQLRIISNTETFNDNEDWNNFGFSMNHTAALFGKLSLHSTAFYSEYKNDHFIESSITRSFREESTQNGFQILQHNQIKGFGWQSLLRYQMNLQHEWTFGIYYELRDIAFHFQNDSITVLQRDDTFYETGLIVEDSYRSGNFQLNAGSRINYYQGTDSYFASPRIKLSCFIGDSWSVKSSFSINHQFDNKLTHENRLGQTLDYWVLSDGKQLPVSQSYNYMIGGHWNSGNFSFDLEGFYRDLRGVLDFSINNPGAFDVSGSGAAPQYRLVKGTGKAYGIDVTAKFENSSYSGWVAYTLSKVTNQFKQVFKGDAFPTQEDRRHQMKFVNNFYIGQWNVNANYILSTGKPYINYSALTGAVSRDELNPANLIVRLPDYHRMDLGIGYTIELTDSKLQLGASVFNLLDRRNVKYLQYIYAIPVSINHNNNLVNTVLGAETELLDRTWNINLKLQF